MMFRKATRSVSPAIEPDADGNFEQDVVIPGMKFQVYGTLKGRYLGPPDRKTAKGLEAKAGVTTDLGNVVVKPD
jgi:hypothetical protein